MDMNILGIDFEEWFHPELIKNNIKNDQKIPKVFVPRELMRVA